MSVSGIVFTAVRRAQGLYRRAISEVLPAAGQALQARRITCEREAITAREHRCACSIFELVLKTEKAECDAPRRTLPAYSKQRIGLLVSHLQQRPISQSEAA
jgi:hypothetical protein